MTKKKLEKIKKRIEFLHTELGEIGPLMRGSVVFIGTKNKQFYFSLNQNKKTKLIYLGKKRVEKAKEYSENYKKLVTLVEEMTVLNMELLKENIVL